MGNGTQISLNYVMTTEERPCVTAGYGLNMGMAFSSYGALQQNSNYAADVMYKPQDTGRRNRICLEFVWEQMKKK